MRLPWMTTRRWMALVAVVALAMGAIPFGLSLLARLLDDVYQPARAHVEKTWPVRAATRVIVDVFDGGI